MKNQSVITILKLLALSLGQTGGKIASVLLVEIT